MVRDGFLEQIHALSEDARLAQQFGLRLTKWIFENFRVKLFRQMSLADLDSKLFEIQAQLKEWRATASQVKLEQAVIS